MKKTVVSDSLRYKEAKKKKRSVLGKRLIFAFSILLIIFVGLSFVLRMERFMVKGVEIRGINSSDSEMVKGIVEKKISGKYLFFFPKNNTLLIPKRNIKEELTNDFLRFKDLEIEVSEDGILIVALSERKQEYIWCGDVFSFLGEIEECYFMDKTGYIFDRAPYFSGDVYFKFFGSIDDQKETNADTNDENINVAVDNQNVLGKNFLQNEFEMINALRERMEKFGIKPNAFVLEEDGDMEFYLPSLSSSMNLPPRIIFKRDADFVKLAENLETALSTEPLLSEYKEKYAFLEYIDLRYGNKVYYRFR